MSESSTFVLVPGGWHGAWCFRDVVARLRALGHQVHTLSLTGLGDRAHLADPRIDLHTHIADVVGLIDAEELDEVVLVGHSYGGMVVTGAAVARPAALRMLVYLDAIVPIDGESLFDHMSPAFRESVQEGARSNGSGYLVPIPTMEFLAVDAQHADWVQRRLGPHPLGTATQPLDDARVDPRIARAYIHCDSPVLEPTRLSKSRIADEDGWIHRTLPTGHDAFITMPDALADTLAELAGLVPLTAQT